MSNSEEIKFAPLIDLIQGDCLEVMKSIPDKSINCIITSPPYNKKFFCKQKESNQVWKGFQINYSKYDDNMPLEEYEKFMIEFINLALKKLSPHGSLFLNHKPIRYNNNVYFPLKFILQSDAKIYQEIIWDRKNSPNIRNDVLVPNTERIYWLVNDKPTVHRDLLQKKFIGEVWNINAKPSKLHPAPFPVDLPTNCILLTTEEGDTILDPFLGSGTTGVACKNLNRNFIGIDIDEKYIEMAKKRISELKGEDNG